MNEDLIGQHKPGKSDTREKNKQYNQKEYEKYLKLCQSNSYTNIGRSNLSNWKHFTSIEEGYPYRLNQPHVPMSMKMLEEYEQQLDNQRKVIEKIQNKEGILAKGRNMMCNRHYDYNFKKLSANQLVLGGKWRASKQYRDKEYEKQHKSDVTNLPRGKLEDINTEINK